MRFLPGSRAPKILELHKGGFAPPVIAQQLNCTSSLVYKTIRRYKTGTPYPSSGMRIAALGTAEAAWLKAEARRIGVPWRDLARAMLNDAIHEAQQEEAIG